eukprot:8666096-Pyramimonas_sp.AAC.1
MQSDVIQAASEESTLQDHLRAMFDPETAPPLEWDTKREYTRDRLEVYYQVFKPIPTMDQADPGSVGIFPRWTNEGLPSSGTPGGRA